jgi:hypothetical protein
VRKVLLGFGASIGGVDLTGFLSISDTWYKYRVLLRLKYTESELESLFGLAGSPVMKPS